MINLQALIDDARCFESVRAMRRPDGVRCPRCSSPEVTKDGRDDTQPERQRYRCHGCHRRFDDLAGTVLAGHHQPLRVWLLCLYFMGLNLSDEQIAQELGIDPDDAQVMASQQPIVIGQCHRRHRHQEFLNELDSKLAREPGVEVHLVPDNYGTHKTAAVKRWFLRHPEYHLHFTPTSGSWLNPVERFFGEITERRIRRGAFRSVAALEAAIREYLEHHNASPKSFRTDF